MFNQIASGHMAEEFFPTWSKFTKDAVMMAQKRELLETRLNSIIAAKNTWKAQAQ